MTDYNEAIKNIDLQCIHIDTETTSTNTKDAEIIEIGAVAFDGVFDKTYNTLINPSMLIPYGAMEVNNITNDMVKNKPTFKQQASDIIKLFDNDRYYVAHNADYDRQVLYNNFKRADIDVPVLATTDRWICTLRLAKFVLKELNEPGLKFSQSYLRYFLELDVGEGVAHRAVTDCIVNRKLFHALLSILISENMVDISKPILPQINEIIWKEEKMPLTCWPHKGKHKGQSLDTIPMDYYDWAEANMDMLDPNNPDHNVELLEYITKRFIDEKYVRKHKRGENK